MATALRRQRSNWRIHVPGDYRPDGRRPPVEVEEEDLGLCDVGQVRHLATHGLGGSLGGIAGTKLADGLCDQRSLATERRRLLLQGPHPGHVSLPGHVATDRTAHVADRRDDYRLRHERAVLAPVDHVGSERLPVREARPHGRVERRRMGPALQNPRVLANDLLAVVTGRLLERRVDIGDPALEIRDLDRLLGLLDGRAEPIVLGLGARMLRQVEADVGDKRPAIVSRQRELHVQMGMRAVGVGHRQREQRQRHPTECEGIDLAPPGCHVRRPDLGIRLAVPLRPEALTERLEVVAVEVAVSTVRVLDRRIPGSGVHEPAELVDRGTRGRLVDSCRLRRGPIAGRSSGSGCGRGRSLAAGAVGPFLRS